MELFGAPIITVYFVTLIIVGGITILYLLFGDFLEGITEVIPLVNPALILAFITFFAASGYLLESITSINSYLIMGISALTALLLDTLLNIFVLIPLSKAEESLTFTTQSLRGRIGQVMIPIPIDGFGEVMIKSNSGNITKTAKSFKNKEIDEGTTVLVVEIENNVILVVPHEV